LGFSIDFAYGP